MIRSASWVVLCGLFTREVLAAEPTKAECIAASEEGQELRHAGKLRASREKLALCIADSCPGPVREDCNDKLEEIEKIAPSIVFVVKNGAGEDVSAVVVTMDGKPFAEKLDGSFVPVDPGAHTFAFEAGGRRVEKKLVIREGQKQRRESVVLGGEVTTSSGPSRVPAYVAFGVGGVGLILGIVFTAVWASDKSAGDNECSQGCSKQRGDSLKSQQDADTAGLAVGFTLAGAGAVVGTILLLTSGGSQTKTNDARNPPRVRFGSMGIEGTFW
jgi:hypothetical protein